ncbi:uncharacterized protein LOC113272052 [Papaver somniferum]|uniref:uncharacterized protein LOC113272052 n=1 Tax=Papaver somniferum TaxID=3469 RepID=UPI000E702A79|nr:uncharacterized protein LOC113272052 [Papaver somniferum]
MVKKMFDGWIHKTLEVYVDDMLVNSKLPQGHANDIREIFEQMRKYNMKINPAKCAFGVTSGKFLRYLVTKSGIEVYPEKVRAILEIPSPATIKDVQRLSGLLAALGRFINRSSDKCKDFFNTLKKGENFSWSSDCEEAFQKIKEHLAALPILQKHDPREDLYIYLSATNTSISTVLTRIEKEVDQPIYFISKTLTSAEKNYSKIEKMVLSLVYATQKLRSYFHAHTVTVITKAPIESVLDHADRDGRISKWGAQIKQFGIKYQSQTAIKTQAVADFLADFPLDNTDEIEEIPGLEDELEECPKLLRSENPRRWEVFVDGSCNSEGSGIGMVFTTPTGRRIVYSLRLEFPATNNIIEYEAVIHALHVIIVLGISEVRQTDGMYQASDPCLQRYLQLAKHYIGHIPNITFRHLNRINNRYADALAYIASMTTNPEATNVRIERVMLPSIPIEGNMDILNLDSVAHEESQSADDWRTPIIKYLANGDLPSDQQVAHKIISILGNYQLRDGILYKQSYLSPLLRCFSCTEGQSILKEIHYGYAGNHSGGRSLDHKAMLEGYFWPRMNEDSKQTEKFCIECQKFGKRRHAPSMDLKSVLSPWPFSKWGVDIVGPLRDGTGQRKYLIVATDYFTKWVEASALRHIRDHDVFTFLFEHIICHFGIPAAIVSDNGAQLQGKNIDLLFNFFKIRKNKSTPIYPESNGQAEATNKTIADMLKKKLDGHGESWCEQLHNVLWAYRTTRREATWMTPFALTYGT